MAQTDGAWLVVGYKAYPVKLAGHETSTLVPERLIASGGVLTFDPTAQAQSLPDFHIFV
jgi:hypothetical protein